MGVQASAVAMYGVYFNSKEDVRNFLKDYKINDIEELESDSNIELCCLNLYNGDPFILGYAVGLGEMLDEYEKQWNLDFPNSKLRPAAHLDVQWW